MAKCTNITIRTGVLCIFLCFALGVANIFHANFVIAFSIVCLYVSFKAFCIPEASLT